MTGPATSVAEKTADTIRRDQFAFHQEEAARFAARLRRGGEEMPDHAWGTYIPPANDDIASWKGITLWCALEQWYIFHAETEADLRRGLRPIYCPNCEDRPDGHRAQLCGDCAWQSYGYDRALAKARELGRKRRAS